MSGDPFGARAFAIELRVPGTDAPLCEAAFCACDGLALRRDVVALREGGDPARARLAVGHESVGTVTLRRGMTATFDLWDWWERVRVDPGLRATCDIVVLSPDLSVERARFRLHGCLPVKIEGPKLNATANDVAIESLEIACEGVELVSRREPPGERVPDPPAPICKAQLRELDAGFEREINPQRDVTVQINPEQLRTTFTHEQAPHSRLDLRLVFDVHADEMRPSGEAADVRRQTEQVAYFAIPQRDRDGVLTRPAVRLAWGSFRFDGHVARLEESLDRFSPDGRPLRAGLDLVLERAQIGGYAFATP